MHHLKQLILASGDMVCLYFGLFVALLVRYSSPTDTNLFLSLTKLFLLAVVILFIVGLYDIGKMKKFWPIGQKTILAASIWAILGVIYFYLNTEAGGSPKTILAVTTLIGFTMIFLWRLFYVKMLSANLLKISLVFVGYTPAAKELAELLHANPDHGYAVVGLINWPEDYLSNVKHYTKNEDWSQVIPDMIIVSPEDTTDSATVSALYNQLTHRVQIVSVTDFYEEIMKRVPPFVFSETWFITHLREQNKKIYDRLRMLLDYIGALIIGAVFIITFPLIALIIKITSRGPVFFSQTRIGRDGQVFKLYKYRTMKSLAADGSAELSGPRYAEEKDDRITPVGKFLRLARLDELPQFINILKNEMALIGPRPERPEFVSRLVADMPFYALRHLVKPGLTGWAQIQNRYYSTADENLLKLEYDLYYVKNRGPLLDLAIALRTINIVLGLKGR